MSRRRGRPPSIERCDDDDDDDATTMTPAKRSGPCGRRPWRFALRAPGGLRDCETPCVVGDCPELGSWAPGAAVPMTRDGDGDAWTLDVDVPAGRDVEYRYCVCVVVDATRTSVRTWETDLKPRKISKDAELPSAGPPDVYGAPLKVERGWLTCETVLQLKFHDRPFAFESKLRSGAFGVKLTPHDFRFGCGDTSPDDSRCVLTEVATVNSPNCKFAPQEPHGRAYSDGDFLVFNVACSNLAALAFTIEFYEHEPGNTRRLVGTSFVMPTILKNTGGQIELPVACVANRKPLGSMRCDYLIVRPLGDQLSDMRASYATYWSSSWTGLDVGHRGSGSSFKAKESTIIRENTIASLKKAASHGADMIEFDVQLSKDLVPVVYHDFHVCIALKRKNQADHNEMLEIPMQDLTLDQLKKLKVFHTVEGRSNEQRFFDEDLVEHQPFPQLIEVLKALDPHVGFNIEIKGTQPLEDGSMELVNPFDLNLYIDKILDVVLRHSGSRHILFSSFHPDICTMLRLKQSLYPTMFLTQGVTKRWPSYRDARCNTIPAAMNHALNAGLLGICVHTEDILRDDSQVKLVIDSGLKIFCWGEDNNNVDTIKYLKQLGLHGVIFDKLDQFSTKEVKESIFSMEAREAEKELMKIAKEEKNNSIVCEDAGQSSTAKN